MVASMTLWLVAKTFAMRVSGPSTTPKYDFMAIYAKKVATISADTSELRGGQNWFQIKAEYDAIKELTDKLNNLVGTRMTFLVLMNTLYYAVLLVRFGNWLLCLEALIYFLKPCAIFLISANICYQVRIRNIFVPQDTSQISSFLLNLYSWK